MNKIYSNTIGLLATAILLAGCSENTWNDKYLDGFEVPPVSDKALDIKYTLTDADYSTLAGLTANKTIAQQYGETAALTAIGKNKCFADEDQARRYLPAFFANSGFAYFNADNGSSIVATYNVAVPASPVVAGIKDADVYAVTEKDYQGVWESEDDYIAAFAPEHPASKSLAKILKSAYPNAVAGQYAVVEYNVSPTNPIFGSVGGETPSFTYTSVLGNVAKDDQLTVRGIVTAIATRGFMITDNSGSLFYDKAGFNDDAINIGTLVKADGTVGVYNRGLQLSVDNSYSVEGVAEYTYPAPVKYDADMITAACAATENINPTYVEIEGTVSVSGKYTNIIIEGTNCQGSPYNATDATKALFTDGQKAKVRGYFVSVSSSKYFNILVTSVEAVDATRAAAKAPVGTPAVTAECSLYAFNGSAWSVPTNTYVLTAADYATMDQTYGNLSGTQPAEMLPLFLNLRKPFAAENDVLTVVYKYYNSTDKVTFYQAKEFKYSDGSWAADNLCEPVTERYNRLDNKWAFDPSVTLVLPTTKGNELSSTFYQTCVDWVYENIDKPLGSTSIKSGQGYVTSYGNNDYYGGSSAYQNNVDIRAEAAEKQYAKGFEGMTADEVTELIKYRFCYEVVPGALAMLYPDAKPVPGLDVLYTITFSAYNGTATAYTGVWKVTGPAKFEFVSCTWWEDGTSPLAK